MKILYKKAMYIKINIDCNIEKLIQCDINRIIDMQAMSILYVYCREKNNKTI